MTTEILVGLDLGTTSSKAIARTCWSAARSGRGGDTLADGRPRHRDDAGSLVTLAVGLIADVVHLAEQRLGPVRVAASASPAWPRAACCSTARERPAAR